MIHNQFVDLHTHTTASDGVCTPAENVRLALKAGLTAIAITDHDTISGIEDARTEGKRAGIVVVPGVEISTVDRGIDVHILGYYMNDKDNLFNERLYKLRHTRNLRNQLIIERLNELGISISMKEVNDHLVTKKDIDQTIGRPHIANVLVSRGIVGSVSEAFQLYLGTEGAAYVNPPRIEPVEAIRWIREAGGKAVIAHPGLYHNEQMVEDIIKHGVDGIEVYHSDHTEDQELYYLQLAKRHKLIVTAGSDFHGTKEGVTYHGAIGSRKIDISVLALLKSLEE